MRMRTTAGDWTFIEAVGLEMKFPTNSDLLADQRVEIRCGNYRLFVESSDDGPLVSEIERFSSLKEEHDA